MRDIEQWREQQSNIDRPLPWWLWPFSLLWRRQPVAEPDTVPAPAPRHVDTVQVSRWPD